MLLHKNDSPLEKKMSGKMIEWKSSKKKESLQDEGNETKFKGHHKLHARSHKKIRDANNDDSYSLINKSNLIVVLYQIKGTSLG